MGFRRLTSLLRNLLHRKRAERELNEEIRAHEMLLADEKIRAGMNPQEAHRQALLELGGLEQLKEQVREVRAGYVLGTFLQDVRFGSGCYARAPASLQRQFSRWYSGSGPTRPSSAWSMECCSVRYLSKIPSAWASGISGFGCDPERIEVCHPTGGGVVT